MIKFLISYKIPISFFVFLFGLLSQAQENQMKLGNIIVNADSMERDTSQETIYLKGHVQVIYLDQHLKSDSAFISLRSSLIIAEGNVYITSSSGNIVANKVIMDSKNQSGIIYGGYVQSGQAVFEGDIIQRLSPTEFLADRATFTTCSTCPEAWTFSGDRVKAEMGGYAYIKNTTLRMGGFPILWLPYIVLPLKSDRQTGLLTPELGASTNGGLTFTQPFFWAISKNQDATISLKSYELRGQKFINNYLYVLSEDSGGELNFAILNDKNFGNSSELVDFHPEQKGIFSRWFLNYQHVYLLPDKYSQRTQLNFTRDNRYYSDFSDENNIKSEPSIENRISLSKQYTDYFYTIDFSSYKTLMSADPLSDDTSSVRRLPEFTFSKRKTSFLGSDILWNYDFQYLELRRNNSDFDAITTDTTATDSNKKKFVSNNCNTADWEKNPSCRKIEKSNDQFNSANDIIRTGRRLDFQTNFFHPFASEYVLFTPSLTYRNTQYNFFVGDRRDNNRQFIRFSFPAETRFQKIYDVPLSETVTNTDAESDGGYVSKIKHEIIPGIQYNAIPWIYHPYHPFFGNQISNESPYYQTQSAVGDKDVNPENSNDNNNSLQFDYNDRVYDRKVINFSLTNRLVQKTSFKTKEPEYFQFVIWKLSQNFDAYLAERDPKAQAWSDLNSEITLTSDKFDVYQKSKYNPTVKAATETYIRLKIKEAYDQFIELDHSLIFPIAAGQTSISYSDRSETMSLALGRDFRAATFLGKMIYDLNPPQKGQSLKTWGYGAKFKLPGDCVYLSLLQWLDSRSNLNYKIYFDFNWDGKNKPKLPDNLLRIFGF